MTTIIALNIIDKYELDRGKETYYKEIAIRVSKASSLLSGTSAQLKFGKWLKL